LESVENASSNFSSRSYQSIIELDLRWKKPDRSSFLYVILESLWLLWYGPRLYLLRISPNLCSKQQSPAHHSLPRQSFLKYFKQSDPGLAGARRILRIDSAPRRSQKLSKQMILVATVAPGRLHPPSHRENPSDKSEQRILWLDLGQSTCSIKSWLLKAVK
jgi:hypothetical protein